MPVFPQTEVLENKLAALKADRRELATDLYDVQNELTAATRDADRCGRRSGV